MASKSKDRCQTCKNRHTPSMCKKCTHHANKIYYPFKQDWYAPETRLYNGRPIGF